ncbi:hypothetical protein [Amycolatopsis sp. NPDC051102]|uniref:hypothetical protein n=1 Tax=Amycolatopsis sp. NPDC051102 TaxID=3155163 RepID=UPI0034271072
MTEVPVADFVRFFGDGGIRVLLDWTRLAAECRIEASTSRSAAMLGDLRTVWYAGPDGRDGEFRDPGARPLRVRETGCTEATWSAERAARISDFETRFRADPGPVQLALPVYVLGDDGFLLLDGTHRAVAAHRAGGEVRLLMFAVHGPRDETMLPDLRF